MDNKVFNGDKSVMADAKNVTFMVHGERFEMKIARNWYDTNPWEITKNVKNVRDFVSRMTCNKCSIDFLMGYVDVNNPIGNINGEINGSRVCFYDNFGGKERVWLIKDERGWRIDYFKNIEDDSVTSEYIGKKMTDKVIAAYLWMIVEMASRAIFVPTSVVLCVKDAVRVNVFDNYVDARDFVKEKYNAYEMEYPDYYWVSENGFNCRVPLEEAENNYMIKMALTTESF